MLRNKKCYPLSKAIIGKTTLLFYKKATVFTQFFNKIILFYTAK